MKNIRVSPDGSGDFRTLADAFASLPKDSAEPVTIEVAPATYREKLCLSRPFVTLVGLGDSPGDVVITYGDYGFAPMPDGGKRGTFRSYTFFVNAPDVTLRNLTVENSSGDPVTHGQAIALYAECDRFMADNCQLIGHQDTLFTGPLPPKEYEPGGFTGPTRDAPRVNGRQYYRNCRICGDVDFIFGSATAYFDGCSIISLGRSDAGETGINGYVTAPSTPEGQEYGYVFSRCDFLADGCGDGSVYLARPWRDFARAVFLDCGIGPHIHPSLYHDWGKERARSTVLFADAGCERTGAAGGMGHSDAAPREGQSRMAARDADARGCADAGAADPFPGRAPFSRLLSEGERAKYDPRLVLSGSDGWEPWK